MAGDRVVGRQEPCSHQRRERQNETGRMAACDSDPSGGSDRVPLAWAQLGQSVGPARCDPMRGTGIDKAGATVAGLDQRHRFAGGIVGQTQKDRIGLVDQLGATGNVLAPLGFDLEQVHTVMGKEPVTNLQAGSAFLAVDEHFALHGRCSLDSVDATVPDRSALNDATGLMSIGRPRD